MTPRTPPAGGERLQKALTLLAAAGLVTAVLVPVRQSWRPPSERRDGFPLSYYPMFSARRRRTGTVVHLLGVDADGESRVLHHRHAGTGGMNQVRRQMNRRVARGAAAGLAAEAARSVAASSRPTERGVVEVQVVSSTHRYDDFFAGDPGPLRRTVHASATVPRPTLPAGGRR
ncbi:hypothetical protein [Desertihabitans aurantiacus]|uniref:hypothetical protein n=1 Tax=Desertihabitans aurantiacus TaxID=2282477 RepID=UPI000DF7F100|nr:hypothetical protein [Desertihabitans aurantiacus]